MGRADDWRATAIYGGAHFGKSLFWYAGEILFAYFLTEIVGLPAAQMGGVLAIGLLFSAGVDLAVARSLGAHIGTASRAAKLQALGSVLCSVFLAVLFLVAWIPQEVRLTYTLFAAGAFRVSYAVYDIPQNALMSLATRDDECRTRLASTRIWFSGLATLAIAAAVGPLIATRSEAGFLALAGIIALVAVVFAAALMRVVAHATVTGAAVSAAPQAAFRLRREFWLMIALMFATSIATPIFAKLEPYFAAYGLRSPWWGGAVIFAMALGIVVGQPVCAWASRRVSRAALLIGAALVQIAALLWFWGASASEPFWLALAAFGFGLGNGGVGMALWVGFSDVVARGPVGREAWSYGFFTATAKVALALGALALGFGLHQIDFRGADSGLLPAAMTLLPALGALVCVAIGAAWSAIAHRARTERRTSATEKMRI